MWFLVVVFLHHPYCSDAAHCGWMPAEGTNFVTPAKQDWGYGDTPRHLRWDVNTESDCQRDAQIIHDLELPTAQSGGDGEVSVTCTQLAIPD